MTRLFVKIDNKWFPHVFIKREWIYFNEETEISLHRLTNLWYMYLHNITLKKEHACHTYTVENDNSLKSQTMNCHTILLYVHHPKDLTSTPKLKINTIKSCFITITIYYAKLHFSHIIIGPDAS